MPFWKAFYHIVWATKHRVPVIVPEVEDGLIKAINGVCARLNVKVLAVGMTADHLHLVVSIPPSLAAAAVVSQIKDASAHAMNH